MHRGVRPDLCAGDLENLGERGRGFSRDVLHSYGDITQIENTVPPSRRVATRGRRYRKGSEPLDMSGVKSAIDDDLSTLAEAARSSSDLCGFHLA